MTGRLVLSFLLQVREEEKGALALAQPLSFYPTDEQNFICSVISDNVPFNRIFLMKSFSNLI